MKSSPVTSRRGCSCCRRTPPPRALGMRAFALPANYAPVAELLKDLRLPPFELSPEGGPGNAWPRPVLTAVAALLAAGLFLALRRRLQARRDDRNGGNGREGSRHRCRQRRDRRA